ncbi:C40 family peptidase [Membranihabitans marinus]|uniref:C40 family peptidase n=1 Tax=Membranihabitans marinus TaxID=1227546 RepID=UPI001F2AC08C|nr:NlpC/P60 family protein [Membranihabitans marinus]
MSCNSGSSTELYDEIETALLEIKKSTVPDRRVAILDFELSEDGSKITGKTSNDKAYQLILQLKEKYPSINLDSFHIVEPMGYGVIHVSVCNMRSQPKHSGELSTQALLGHPITLWDQQGDWYYIQSPDQYLGWLDKGAFTQYSSGELTEYRSKSKIIFKQDFGFCYTHPNTSSEVVSDLVAGDILQIVDSIKDYYKVEFPDGRQGYVLIDQCFEQQPFSWTTAPEWADIESTAKQFMGRPYLWGGTSGKGVDCSGFTKMVYYLNGLVLPRDASQQVHVGKPIEIDDNLSNLQPGDFLFFGKKGENGNPDKVSHVAIHLQDGEIIHSAQRVQIESLNPNHDHFNVDRRNTLLSARRMLTQEGLQQGVIPLLKNSNYAW